MAAFTDERYQSTTPSSEYSPRAPKPIHKIVHRQQQLWNATLALLFPPKCISCQRTGWDLCPACAQMVSAPPAPLCHRCGRMQSTPSTTCALCLRMDDWALTWVRAATLLMGPIHPAIHAFKYNGNTELAIPLARYLVTVLQQPEFDQTVRSIDYIVPVPLYAERLNDRGYNQAELLAAAVSRAIDIPILPSGLSRICFEKSQVDLTFSERQSNVRDAFRTSENFSQKDVLLIDDVYTTGATLNECAKALHRAGATNIVGLTLSMPIRREQV